MYIINHDTRDIKFSGDPLYSGSIANKNNSDIILDSNDEDGDHLKTRKKTKVKDEPKTSRTKNQ